MEKTATYSWYSKLIKPEWAPPSWLFGPVWTILYIIIAFSFGTVFYRLIKGHLSFLVALPFILNLIFNFAFTPIQFGLRNNLFALIDILLVVGTLIWALISVWHNTPDLRWVAYINIPYLIWAVFATILQLNITYLNK